MIKSFKHMFRNFLSILNCDDAWLKMYEILLGERGQQISNQKSHCFLFLLIYA